jgi:type IV pilus assembly protein PilY1
LATNPDGTFKATSLSYWTTLADGGFVDRGGVGEALLTRVPARNIYTYVDPPPVNPPTSANLTDAKNSFTTGNLNIIPATLGVATVADKDRLINYIHGQDAFDADSDGNLTEKRRWILGDVLHSKPLVVNYNSYSSASEGSCVSNKTLIFVGANDGMLHAFRDCDGSEAWAFIPPDLLNRLQYLTDSTRTYYVDGSPVTYTFDKNKDGIITPADGDKVVLIFGERRGGGFYYALDVSNPDAPTYLWRRSAATDVASYGELGQSWSDPQLAKVKDGANGKVVAILGAGYDNANEDGRYGATQTFTGTGTTSGNGEGAVTSGGAVAPLAPKGRGVYVVEVATLDGAGVPSASTGTKVWGFSYGAALTTTTDPAMTFSIPSSVSALDRDNDGFTDRFYAGDTGGNMWRFDIADPAPVNWRGRKIFSSNPGSGGASDVGRKIFYKPSVTLEVGYEALFFGTGDREHPLNTAVLDRLYSVKDKSDAAMVTETGVSSLVDVTTNTLQETSLQTDIDGILLNLNLKYGWYIKLDLNLGEKVLAPALTFREVYFTTYTPDASAAPDPCQPGNLGVARVYILNNKTGEAAFNFDVANDSTFGSSNYRAKTSDGKVLKRIDRVGTIRSGIPSGVVLVINPSGDVTALVGCGGALCSPPPPDGGNTFQMYWRRVL